MPSRPSPTITVLIDGQPQANVRAIRVQRSTGGKRLDHAIVRVDLGKAGQRVQHFALPVAENREVQIVGALPNQPGKPFTYFWGKVRSTKLVIEDGREELELVCQITEELFGQPITGVSSWSTEWSKDVEYLTPILFNPQLDGRIYGNASVAHTATTPEGDPVRLVVDPESIRTQAARQAQGEVLSDGKDPSASDFLWKLSEVVLYLCWRGNLDPSVDPEFPEPYIDNPSAADLQAVIDDANDLVRNLHLPQGLYLPDALDRVLAPLGYDWFVHLDADADYQPLIQVFKRGVGTGQVDVALQAPGSIVSTDVTGAGSNVAAAQLAYDLTAVYNAVLGLGGYKTIEGTFYLSPCWDESLDDPTGYPPAWLPSNKFGTWDVLNRDNPRFDALGLHDVWRKFALNEAGDYNGLRNVLDTYDWSDLKAAPAVLPVLAKRRRFLPTLTLSADMRPIGPLEGTLVEYYDPVDKIWKRLPTGCSLLHTECGVYFSDREIPQFLQMLWYQLGDADDIGIRITASVAFDERLFGSAEGTPSPNADRRLLALDWEHLFVWHVQDSGSIYYPQVQNKTLKADVREDITKLVNFAKSLVGAWNLAAVNGPITIEGIDDFRAPPAYEVGQAVVAIGGRDIALNAGVDGQTPVYPQIVGITYDFQRQRTTLQLERYRDREAAARQAEGAGGELGALR
jgi:hypothetical protein